VNNDVSMVTVRENGRFFGLSRTRYDHSIPRCSQRNVIGRFIDKETISRISLKIVSIEITRSFEKKRRRRLRVYLVALKIEIVFNNLFAKIARIFYL